MVLSKNIEKKSNLLYRYLVKNYNYIYELFTFLFKKCSYLLPFNSPGLLLKFFSLEVLTFFFFLDMFLLKKNVHILNFLIKGYILGKVRQIGHLV